MNSDTVIPFVNADIYNVNGLEKIIMTASNLQQLTSSCLLYVDQTPLLKDAQIHPNTGIPFKIHIMITCRHSPLLLSIPALNHQNKGLNKIYADAFTRSYSDDYFKNFCSWLRLFIFRYSWAYTGVHRKILEWTDDGLMPYLRPPKDEKEYKQYNSTHGVQDPPPYNPDDDIPDPFELHAEAKRLYTTDKDTPDREALLQQAKQKPRKQPIKKPTASSKKPTKDDTPSLF